MTPTPPQTTEGTTCPVCDRRFKNPGATAAHVKVTKDTAHQAFRLAGSLEPAPEASPEPAADPLAGLARFFASDPPDPAESGSSHPTHGSPEPDPETQPGNPTQSDPATRPERPSPTGGRPDPQGPTQPEPDPPDPAPPDTESKSQREADPAPRPEPEPQPDDGPADGWASPEDGGLIEVSFGPPPDVGPLLPDPATQPGAKPVPSVQVPLEPIIAGGVTTALNGLILGKPEDGQLALDEVRQTGFPKAVTACLELYFPELPLDHPITALIASGASLGMLVASRKGMYADKARPEPTRPNPTRAAPARPARQPDPEPEEEPDDGGTGSAYWDAILQQAGGEFA